MKAEEMNKSCSDGDTIYQHGSEFCKDVYCIRCSDGTLEMYPQIGAIIDLSEVW